MFCRACPGGPPWRTLEVLPGAPLGACRRGAGRGRAAGRGAACGCALTFAECLLSRVLVSPLSCLAHDGQIGVTRWPGLSRVVATWAHVQVSEGWSGCPSISCQHSGPKDRAKPCGPSVAAAGVGLPGAPWGSLPGAVSGAWRPGQLCTSALVPAADSIRARLQDTRLASTPVFALLIQVSSALRTARLRGGLLRPSLPLGSLANSRSEPDHTAGPPWLRVPAPGGDGPREARA